MTKRLIAQKGVPVLLVVSLIPLLSCAPVVQPNGRGLMESGIGAAVEWFSSAFMEQYFPGI